MKFLVVFAVALACASADVSHIVKSDDFAAPIIRSDYVISPEGNAFNYAYETGNKIVAQAEGVVQNPNSEDATLVVKGSYSYVSPDGTPVETVYVAGPNGFEAQGSHIPVSPEVPEPILRSLKYIADHPQPVDRRI